MITGHCFDAVHSSMIQKLLELLDVEHSEEPQRDTNNQFFPFVALGDAEKEGSTWSSAHF